MAENEGLSGPDDPSARRRAMVERQIRGRGIDDERILAAFESVPRHLFVAPDLQDAAYEDRPLPIGESQTISQPYIVARMADLARIQPDDSVLEIGTGCGYAAAVLGELADRVVSVEIRPRLANDARRRLEDLGYGNVRVLTGDDTVLDRGETFDAIVVAAAPGAIPESLEERLADGGRLVIPVGGRFGQHLWTVDRHGDDLERTRHDPVAFVPLIE